MPNDAHAHQAEPLYLPDELLRVLIDEQFPHLADQELGRRYTLEDHYAVRVGDDYGALFPRSAHDDYLYARAADLIRPHAEAWTFHSSHPLETGLPGHGYPYHWSLVDWMPASTAGFVPLHPTDRKSVV